MKTDQLIGLLASNLEPVRRGQTERAIVSATIAGGAAAYGVMRLTLPVLDLGQHPHLPFLMLKLAFTLALVSVGVVFLVRSTRPGRDDSHAGVALVLPFVLLAGAGVAGVMTSPTAEWAALLLGTQWALCCVCIPLFAIVPFGALTWAVRKGAPTDLRRAGAIVGLVAGGLGAAAYAFACPDHALPFIALWYSVPIGLCAFGGATVGPHLLRW